MAESKTFYSRDAAGLTCYAEPVRKAINSDGVIETFNPPPIRFTPIGQSRFGMLTTSDPVVIAYLEKRMETSRDVITSAEFNELMQSPEQRQAETKLLREENRLLKLQLEKAAAKAQPEKPAPTPAPAQTRL